MKDIYSPLEIDEEWDNYAPMADAGAAVMNHPAGKSPDGPTDASGLNTEGAKDTNVPVTPDSTDVMPKSRVMSGSESISTGTKESTEPDAAYDAAEKLIGNPAADADLVTTPGFAATDGDTFDINDTRGLVRITPEPTSGETTTEIPSTGTPHEIKGVPIKVMGGETSEETPDSNDTLSDPNVTGGEAADSGDKLPEVVDQSKGGTSSPDVPVITPYIAPVEPGEEPKDETKGDSDIVIDTGTIAPDTFEASDDDTESAEADTSSTDSDDQYSKAKSDEPKVENKDTAPASGDTTIEAVKNDLLKRVVALNKERGKIQASIEAMEKDKKKYTDDYNEDMAAIGDGIKAANEKLANYDKFIAQLESLK